MDFLSQYLILAILVFGINVVPALMPPTWLILVFFFIRFHLALLPTVVVGAIAATSGRLVLAVLARPFRKFFHLKSQANLDTLGHFFNSHVHITIPLLMAYAFFPIPSNHVYIAAGLARMNLKILAFSFLVGRLISYTFWILVTHRIAASLEKIFSRYYAKPGSFVLEILGFSLIYLLTKIHWKSLFKRLDNRR